MSDYTVPVKMNLKHMMLEITRECNLKCVHCMRGDAQNVTITPEIIDKMLDNINSIEHLTLTGGEPFLHPEMIEYLFDGIIERNIYVEFVSTVTNGAVCNMRTAMAFSKIADYIAHKRKLDTGNKNIKCSRISLSTDKYHEASPLYLPEATYQFYKKNCSSLVLVEYERLSFRDEAIKAGNEPKYIDTIINDGYSGMLYYSGRAKESTEKVVWQLDCSCHRFAFGDEKPDFICKEFKPETKINKLLGITRVPLVVYCGVEFTAKGGILMFASTTFDEHDKLAKDNILDCSLYDALWNWNQRYPLSCAEAERLYRLPSENILNRGDQKLVQRTDGPYSIEDAKKDLLALDDLIWVRQQLQNRYKNKYLPFSALMLATANTASDALELPAHDLDNRWKLLRKASKELKAIIIAAKIDPDCPDLKYDDTDYDNTTDDDGLGFMAMMELLEKY